MPTPTPTPTPAPGADDGEGCAFGKVILLGEHAVVHGYSALAGALALASPAAAESAAGAELAAPPAALRCQARRPVRGSDSARLSVPAWGLDVELADRDHPVAVAVTAILTALGAPPLALDVTTSLPAGAGLGSSAALAVAVTRAAARWLGRALDDDAVARIADAAERCFHANPSGVDVALATRGGLGLFRRGDGLAPIAGASVELVIGLSGEPRSTAVMVRRVAAALAADAGAAARLAALGAAAERGATALVSGDRADLGRLLSAAHADLAALGVSSPGLDALVRLAGQAGALGAKLTGAGGGGAVIALAPGREAAVLAAWRAAGFTAFVGRVGGNAA